MEEEFLVIRIYGGGQACAQGERLGYQGTDQQGEGHGLGVECRIRVGGCVTSLRW